MRFSNFHRAGPTRPRSLIQWLAGPEVYGWQARSRHRNYLLRGIIFFRLYINPESLEDFGCFGSTLEDFGFLPWVRENDIESTVKIRRGK